MRVGLILGEAFTGLRRNASMVISVVLVTFVSLTFVGAAMLAGLGCGWFGSLEEAAAMRGEVETFAPQLDAAAREGRLEGWRAALQGVLNARG